MKKTYVPYARCPWRRRFGGNDAYHTRRFQAVKKLFEGLFKPGWMGTDPNRARKSLQAVTDEAALMEIIRDAPLQEIRLAATDRIHSEDRLLALADHRALSSPTVKAHALEVYVGRLSYPKDEGRLVEKILKNRDIDEAGAAARKKAARLLPADHAMLDQPCCPRCGCVDAVMNYTRLKHTPVGFDGFRCAACGKSADARHEDISLRNHPAPQDFSVPLRDFSR